MPLSFPNPDGNVGGSSRAVPDVPVRLALFSTQLSRPTRTSAADQEVRPHQDRSMRAKLNPFYAKVESYRLRDVP